MWSLCSTVVSGGRMMSAAVTGAAALACSGICSTSTFLPLPFPGSGAWRWPWDRNVRRVRASVSTLFAGLAGYLVKVGPILALNGSTGQARRKANLDAVRIDPYGRLPGFSPSAPEEDPVGRSAGRCSIATSSPGESASTSSSGSPILLRPVGMGCGPSSRRTRTCLRFASSVTSAATRSPRAAQAQRLIADGGKLLLNCPSSARPGVTGPPQETADGSCLPRCQPSPTRYRKLALPERAGLKQRRMRTVDLPRIQKASDKPSDYDPRQYQTERDALRHYNRSDLR